MHEVLDRPLPHSVEAEQSVLGSILIEPSNFDLADEMLQGEEFFLLKHQKIFECMKDLTDAGEPIDTVTLATQLNEKGLLGKVGGVTYLTQLAQSVPSAANLAHYASIVKSKAVHRQAILELQNQLQEAAESEDAEEVIAKFQMAAERLSGQARKSKGFRPISELVQNHSDVLDKRYKNRAKGLTGVKTPLIDLDRLTGGRQKGDLIIVAARPSVGKTAFEMNEAVVAAESGTVNAVGFFSLEMGDTALVDRFIAMLGRIDGMKLRTGQMEPEDWERYTMAAGKLSKLPLYIDSDPGLTIQQIRAKGRSFKREHGEILLIVDYLQMITAGKRFQNRDTEIGFVTQQLKEMARELDCPVIAISSLGRSVEQRADKRPMLSDLRESGQIEFHADEVDFLYREDYYNADTDKKNIVEIIVAKGRNTGTGKVEALYEKNFSKFSDLQTGYE